MNLILGMEHRLLNVYNVYVNDEAGLSLNQAQMSGERLHDHWSSSPKLFSFTIAAVHGLPFRGGPTRLHVHYS